MPEDLQGGGPENTRTTKHLERISLSYERPIFELLSKNPATGDIIVNPNSRLLIVGDPKFVMAGYFPNKNRTVIEADSATTEDMKPLAEREGINLVQSVYPLVSHETGYNLIILKNILSFNRENPNFLPETVKDLAPGGFICISESIPYRSTIPKLLEESGLVVLSQKNCGFLGTGTIFIAHQNESPM